MRHRWNSDKKNRRCTTGRIMEEDRKVLVVVLVVVVEVRLRSWWTKRSRAWMILIDAYVRRMRSARH